MAVDPRLFESEAKALGIVWPDVGQRVRYRTRAHLGEPRQEFEGVVAGVWLGIEVMVEVTGGPTFCPALGDTFEVLP